MINLISILKPLYCKFVKRSNINTCCNVASAASTQIIHHMGMGILQRCFAMQAYLIDTQKWMERNPFGRSTKKESKYRKHFNAVDLSRESIVWADTEVQSTKIVAKCGFKLTREVHF